ncbi:LysR family transcriptional regulator [Sphingomonas pituitosa]|uniref:LysR family transcriptional regulator n=1 Tax=Sphingomonas pituitosa TaxID=99597 RepID=UPI0008304D4F|nr:LysR family transcriptional regulator [Sphingomonas pituitosa]
MSLPRLRTFVEVYRQRSMSGAARTLGMTQPAVSQHIAGLEIAIGRPLFERQVRGVVPTAAADDLAADIGDSLDEAEQALSAARARSSDIEGAVQIIGHADFLSEVLSTRLRPLLDTGVRVRLHAAHRDLIVQMLIEGHCDLGISGYPVTDPRLRTETIRSEPILAVASPAIADRIEAASDRVAAMSSEPTVAYNFELPLFTQWLAHNRLHAVNPVPAVVSQDLRALRSILCSGFGWSVLPAYMCRAAIERGELRELMPPNGATHLPYYMIWSPAALRHPRISHARQALVWALKA